MVPFSGDSQLHKAPPLESRMKTLKLTHSLVTQSSCICSADKVSANTLTVVVPLRPHMLLKRPQRYCVAQTDR